MTSFSARAGWARLTMLISFLVVAAVAAVWLWSRRPTQPTIDAGRPIAEAFLQNLRDGHADKAWKATTAEFKRDQGKESFIRKVKPLKFLKDPLSFVSVQTVTIADQPRSEYLYQAGAGESVRIVLGREGTRWKVDRWTLP